MSPGKMSVSQAQDVGFLRIFVDMFVDTHTHFYDEWLLPDAEAAIQRALDAGVGKMIQADVDSHERPAMWEVGRRHPGVLFQMLGLYPGSVAADWREELDQVFSLSGERDCVAIGEIGLDYHEGLEFVQQQKEVLRQQLELAASLDLPVNIHLRDAWEDFLAILADCKHLNLRGNLHCFTSSYEIYAPWASAGWSPSGTPPSPKPWSASPWRKSSWRPTLLTSLPFPSGENETKAPSFPT